MDKISFSTTKEMFFEFGDYVFSSCRACEGVLKELTDVGTRTKTQLAKQTRSFCPILIVSLLFHNIDFNSSSSGIFF